MITPRRLSREQIDRAVTVDAETGLMVWKDRPWVNPTTNKRDRGKAAGAKPTPDGYVLVTIDRVTVARHRLIWFWVHGTWPPFLDHIRGVEAGDGIGNLREATRAENNRNARRRKDNTSGIKGVSRCPNNPERWVAQIQFDNRPIFLGRHRTKEEAGRAYQEAAVKYFGEFARTE